MYIEVISSYIYPDVYRNVPAYISRCNKMYIETIVVLLRFIFLHVHVS